MGFDWNIYYKGNLRWLQDRTVLLVRHGSHAYGLNIEGSDEDFKGVAVAPRNYYMGFDTFEQAEQKDPHPDLVIYEIRKFMRLAADCNPSIIEVLWCDPLVCTPVGEKLIEARDSFLSTKAKYTFSGYAISQIRRIERHRSWLLNPPKAQPTRTSMGLPERTLIPKDQLAAAESMINKQLESWMIDNLSDVDDSIRRAIQYKMSTSLAEMKLTDQPATLAARTLGFSDNFILLLDKERSYTSKKREWDAYQDWKRNRNPKRAAIEEKFGYDCKHGLHVIRLLRMAREILTDGKVIVYRPDREELLDIRFGRWPFEKLLEAAKTAEAELDTLVQGSPLPKTPDRNKISKLCEDLVYSMLAA